MLVRDQRPVQLPAEFGSATDMSSGGWVSSSQGGLHDSKGVGRADHAAVQTSEEAATSTSRLPYVFAAWSFAISMLFFPFYTTGDQLAYRFFYETRDGVDIVQSFADYKALIGSQEPTYFLLVTAFSGWVDKDLLVSVVNAIFGYYLGVSLVRLNVSRIVLCLLGLNYYLFILYLSAERFKLAVLFVLVGAAYTGTKRYAAVLAAVLAHVQTLLLVYAQLFARAVLAIRPLLSGRAPRSALWAAAGTLLIGLPLLPLMEHTLSKVEYYSSAEGQGGVAALVKPAAFAALTLVYAQRNRLAATAMQVPIVAASAVVGAERLAIFSYFIFMYYGLQNRRGLNIGVLLSSLYFASTGIIALVDIVNHGSAFYWKTSPLMRLF